MQIPTDEFKSTLIETRSRNYSSARELFQKRKFSFSYGTYILFERGERLPTSSQLTEIIRALDVSPEPLLLAWASAQFDEPDLKSVFGEKRPPSQGTTKDLPLPSLDSTWVLNKRDIDEVLKNPWIWDVISDVVTSFPNGISVQALEKQYDCSPGEITSKYLKRWISNDDIRQVGDRLVSLSPFVHLPAIPQSDQIRNASIRRAAENLTLQGRADIALKRLLQLRLSEKNASTWITRFEQMISDFREAGAKGGGEKQLYQLVFLFGLK